MLLGRLLYGMKREPIAPSELDRKKLTDAQRAQWLDNFRLVKEYGYTKKKAAEFADKSLIIHLQMEGVRKRISGIGKKKSLKAHLP